MDMRCCVTGAFIKVGQTTWVLTQSQNTKERTVNQDDRARGAAKAFDTRKLNELDWTWKELCDRFRAYNEGVASSGTTSLSEKKVYGESESKLRRDFNAYTRRRELLSKRERVYISSH